MTAEALVPAEVRQTTEGGHDRFGHYLMSGDVGKLSKALCGKEWIPEGEGSKFSLCPTCDERWRRLLADVPSEH